jgi:hypothetical protein
MRIGRLVFLSLSLSALGLSLCASAAGQNPWSQLAKLSGTEIGVGGQIGTSAAISGNTIVVGAPFGGSNGAGVAYVFVKPPSGWGNMVQTATLASSDGIFCDFFGASVAISGNTIVVGSSQNDPFCVGEAAGAVYVFVEPSGGWSGTVLQTAKLTASDGAIGDALGSSVSLSGNTLLAGAPGTYPSSKPGSAYVFVEPASGWANMTQTAKLTESDGVAGDEFGSSASIDAGTAAVGSPSATSGTIQPGAAYLFVEPSGGWKNHTQTAKLLASDGAAGDRLGSSISVSGGTVAAGAPNATIGSNPLQGAAYVFVEPPSGWTNATQTGKLTASDGLAGDLLGSSVATNDASVVSGASYYMRGPHTSGGGIAESYFREGAVYVFSKPPGGWTTASSKVKLTGSDARFGSYLGSSVAITGSTVVSGAPILGKYIGAAYVFAKP